MITSDQFDKLLLPLVDLFEDFIQSVLNDIARRIIKTGEMTATAKWQMQRLLESGLVYTDALDRLTELTGKSQIVLKDMFDKAGFITTIFDNTIYEAAGLRPLPIPLSPAMQQVLLAGLRKTVAEVVNLTLTTAIDGQNMFVEALDTAYMQVVHGTMSYTQAIKAGIKSIAKQGLNIITYKNTRDQVDVAVRRAVLTGVAQTTGNLQMYGALESGIDLVQTSAHIGARPAHQLWQGKVFSVSGKNPMYPAFSATGYGTIGGLCGVNCRHSFYPFYEGISEPAYKQATLNEYAETTVPYNGKDIPIYDALQGQRAIEREIRKTKREAGMLGAAGMGNVEEMDKIHSLQAKMRDFIRQTGLDRQSVREGGRVKVNNGIR